MSRSFCEPIYQSDLCLWYIPSTTVMGSQHRSFGKWLLLYNPSCLSLDV